MVQLAYDWTGTVFPIEFNVDIRDQCEIAEIYFEGSISDMLLVVGSPNFEQTIRVGNNVADLFQDPLRCGQYDCFLEHQGSQYTEADLDLIEGSVNEFLMSQYGKTETFNEVIELVCELPDWPMAGQFRSD